MMSAPAWHVRMLMSHRKGRAAFRIYPAVDVILLIELLKVLHSWSDSEVQEKWSGRYFFSERLMLHGETQKTRQKTKACTCVKGPHWECSKEQQRLDSIVVGDCYVINHRNCLHAAIHFVSSLHDLSMNCMICPTLQPTATKKFPAVMAL